MRLLKSYRSLFSDTSSRANVTEHDIEVAHGEGGTCWNMG